MIEIKKKGDDVSLRFVGFSEGVVHFFSGRKTVNAAVEMAGLFGSRSPFMLRQVHGSAILLLQNGDDLNRYETGKIEADAIITDIARLPIAVYTADCLPVLIHDPAKEVVAIIHAGWRSSLGGIAGAVIEKMASHFSSDPADLNILFGPSIQSCCFEVGMDVISRVREEFPGDDSLSCFRGDKGYMDLKRFNRNLLSKSGVVNFYDVDLCTSCNPGLFYSYRRNGRTKERMINVIMLEK